MNSDKTRLRLWLRLLSLSRRIEAQLRERLRREFDTTLPRFDVLAALSRHSDGLTMSALSRELLVSNGNVTGIIERLQADAWVWREPAAADKRVSIIGLTKHGRENFDHMAAAHQRWVDELLAEFDDDSARQLLVLLTHEP